jgi:hypothetical protein
MTSRCLVRIAFLCLLVATAVGNATVALAQEPAAKPGVPAMLPTISVRVDVVMSRFQGEKKLSSMPFSLLANAADARDPRLSGTRVSLRMGIDVPVGTATATENRTTPTNGNTGNGSLATGTTTTKIEYRSVGTNIDSSVNRIDETHFIVFVNVSDSSIYSADGSAKDLKNTGPEAFRTFSTNNTATFRDGQTILFGVATDKITGETMKIEVTLNVIK